MFLSNVVRAAKLEAQKPSTISEREWNALEDERNARQQNELGC